MFVTAPGVPAAPPTSGLVAAAGRPTLPEHWENGISWIPERCAATYQLAPWCADAPTGYDAPRPGAAYYRPVELRIADECTTLAGPVDLERVRRVADANAPFAIARELWTGEGTLADPFSVLSGDPGDATNAYLASPDAEVVGSGAASPLAGMGRLEQAAMEAAGGQAVMLHVPVAVSWELAGSLFRVGQQCVTASGNQVVFDGAYPGTGPAGQQPGATVWAYATAPVAVAMSPLDIQGDDLSTVDRAHNTRTTWTSRVFAAVFDPCVHLATELTI